MPETETETEIYEDERVSLTGGVGILSASLENISESPLRAHLKNGVGILTKDMGPATVKMPILIVSRESDTWGAVPADMFSLDGTQIGTTDSQGRLRTDSPIGKQAMSLAKGGYIDISAKRYVSKRVTDSVQPMKKGAVTLTKRMNNVFLFAREKQIYTIITNIWLRDWQGNLTSGSASVYADGTLIGTGASVDIVNIEHGTSVTIRAVDDTGREQTQVVTVTDDVSMAFEFERIYHTISVRIYYKDYQGSLTSGSASVYADGTLIGTGASVDIVNIEHGTSVTIRAVDDTGREQTQVVTVTDDVSMAFEFERIYHTISVRIYYKDYQGSLTSGSASVYADGTLIKTGSFAYVRNIEHGTSVSVKAVDVLGREQTQTVTVTGWVNMAFEFERIYKIKVITKIFNGADRLNGCSIYINDVSVGQTEYME